MRPCIHTHTHTRQGKFEKLCGLSPTLRDTKRKLSKGDERLGGTHPSTQQGGFNHTHTHIWLCIVYRISMYNQTYSAVSCWGCLHGRVCVGGMERAGAEVWTTRHVFGVYTSEGCRPAEPFPALWGSERGWWRKDGGGSQKWDKGKQSTVFLHTAKSLDVL